MKRNQNMGIYATAEKIQWQKQQPQENWQMKCQQEEHEASITPRAPRTQGCEGQLQPGPVYGGPEQHKNQCQEWRDNHNQ
jgi:hypothetical protein